MKNIILIVIVVLLLTSCISIKTINEELLVEDDIEGTVKTTNTTLDKLGEKFGKLDFKVQYEPINEKSTKIEISSKDNTVNDIIVKAIEQEYYLKNGGTIPIMNDYAEKKSWPLFPLTVINAGLTTHFGMKNDILYENKRGLRWFLSIGYGVFDIAYLSFTIYGIAKRNSDYIFVGILGLALFKVVPLTLISDIQRHNELVSSGYNFDENYKINIEDSKIKKIGKY